MEISAAQKQFLHRIKDAGKTLAKLTPGEGIGRMLSFYIDERTEGCDLDSDGDMLLYQWGTYHFGEEEFFEINITRQFYSEDENIFQLLLNFRFDPASDFRKAGKGNLWCDSPDKVQEFQQFILSSAAFQNVIAHRPANVELNFERV